MFIYVSKTGMVEINIACKFVILIFKDTSRKIVVTSNSRLLLWQYTKMKFTNFLRDRSKQ